MHFLSIDPQEMPIQNRRAYRVQPYYMLPAALEYPVGIEMVPACTGRLAKEGRMST